MDKAFISYENALRYNPYNLKALSKVAQICKKREQYTKVCSKFSSTIPLFISASCGDVAWAGQALEFLKRALNADPNNTETWGALGYC